MGTRPGPTAVVKRAFAAFADRDADALLAVVDPAIVFWAVTGEEVGRAEPYVGHAGMRQYLADVAAAWEDLRLAPSGFEERGDWVIVTGRVWARRGGQVLDSEAGWRWRVVGDRIVYGKVYRSPDDAIRGA